MAGGRITPSQSCTCSSAQSRCVEGAAALPSAPSMQGLFPRGRCASGHPEQPGRAGTQVKSSFPSTKQLRNNKEYLGSFASKHIYMLYKERGKYGEEGRGELGWKAVQGARWQQHDAGVKGESWEDCGVSKAPLIQHRHVLDASSPGAGQHLATGSWSWPEPRPSQLPLCRGPRVTGNAVMDRESGDTSK